MLARQNSIVELHMLAAYVKTNARFGGRVAQTLSHLIDQLRNQHRLKREIRAATAETRASATILVALTIFVIVLMGVSNADYMQFFFSSTQGRVIFSCLIGWPCIGMLVMKRILTLDF
jgi:tight adherence protein B